jgi:hypothetical protein
LAGVQGLQHLPFAAVGVLGLIPTDIDLITEKGRIKSLKISSLYFQLQKTITNSETVTELRFRVLDFVRAFFVVAGSALDSGKVGRTRATQAKKTIAGRRKINAKRAR